MLFIASSTRNKLGNTSEEVETKELLDVATTPRGVNELKHY